MEKLSVKIAGEIVLSETPGGTMKKWREIFGVTQGELSSYLKLSPSIISDYEGNRRASPGIAVVRRFVDALIAIDVQKGGAVTQKFREESADQNPFDTHEFSTSISALDFAKAIEAKPIANEELLEQKKLYGYTLLDSIRVILELPYNDYPKLYGSMSERAFIFTKVSTGRSPMVVIRVTPMKPSLVVLHGLKGTVDKLAVKIAEKEQIPVLLTSKRLDKITEILNKM